MLSVVIPNWNGAHFLPACLDALLHQTNKDIEIIVVDGGSKDQSKDIVSRYMRRSPKVHWKGLPKNLGFAGNCNAGLRDAQGKYIALLNNDTEVSETWAGKIVEAADASVTKRVGIFASKILEAIPPKDAAGSAKKIIQSAGDYLQTNGFADSRGVREPDIGQFDMDCEVFSASGAAAVYRSEMIHELQAEGGENTGLLDEAFRAYLEDTELGMRAHLSGWKCEYIHTAELCHRRNQTAYPAMAHYYVARNTILLIFIGFPSSLLLRYLPRIILAQLRVLRRAHRWQHQPGNRERIRGVIDGLRMLPSIWEKRRFIQGRKIPTIDEEIDRLLRWGDKQMDRRKQIGRHFLPMYVR